MFYLIALPFIPLGIFIFFWSFGMIRVNLNYIFGMVAGGLIGAVSIWTLLLILDI